MKQGMVKMFGAVAMAVTSLVCGTQGYAEDKSASCPIAGGTELKWADAEGKKTIYVAYWTHTPENCPGRSADGAKMLNRFWEGRKKAEEKGIKILGAFVTVTEHDYYIIVEANDYSAVVEFFLPLVPSQTGKFAPVLTMDEWLKIMPK